MDESGNESSVSFIVRAVTLSDGSSVRIDGLSFSPGTAGFHVYRGTYSGTILPDRIESSRGPAIHGYRTEQELIAPLDPNFDHANFYWRMELQSEIPATIHSTSLVGNEGLQMTVNRYRGMIARISRAGVRDRSAASREYGDGDHGVAGMGR